VLQINTLIIYDSKYGNTEKIAESIGSGIKDDVRVIKVEEADPSVLEGIDMLIVGSPTQRGRPTTAIKEFLNSIPSKALKNVRIAAFDTRYAFGERGIGIRILGKMLGFAAGRIMGPLKSKGGNPIADPEGFLVGGEEGPFKDGELERAAVWAARIIE